MQSRVTCNSLCNVKVNIMEGQLVAIGRKSMNRICDIITINFFTLFLNVIINCHQLIYLFFSTMTF